uniref:uncharacterized protein LOC114590009 isoform X2 n=1 Tax=Podarcis muralis TaxID=64176 RepID=UPI00109F57E3|nr:uncharacterized protein LOC114590009 isoform X2 [Podarcis muralis]
MAASGSCTPPGSLEAPLPGFPKAILRAEVQGKYLCSECEDLLRRPFQAQCGHRYCAYCLKKLVGSGPLPCAACLREGLYEEGVSVLDSGTAFPDNAARREVESLPAACLRKDCPWKGTVKEYEAHEEACPKFPLTCDGCGKTDVPRESFADHVRSCGSFRAPCRFRPVGCGEVLEKEALPLHEAQNFPEHLGLLLDFALRLGAPDPHFFGAPDLVQEPRLAGAPNSAPRLLGATPSAQDPHLVGAPNLGKDPHLLRDPHLWGAPHALKEPPQVGAPNSTHILGAPHPAKEPHSAHDPHFLGAPHLAPDPHPIRAPHSAPDPHLAKDPHFLGAPDPSQAPRLPPDPHLPRGHNSDPHVLGAPHSAPDPHPTRGPHLAPDPRSAPDPHVLGAPHLAPDPHPTRGPHLAPDPHVLGAPHWAALELKASTLEKIVCVLNREVERLAAESAQERRREEERAEALTHKVRGGRGPDPVQAPKL